MNAPARFIDFIPEFEQPEYPDILTRADWDRKKGVIAKLYGRTGIGDECDKVLAAYRKVKWQKFDLHDRLRLANFGVWAQDACSKPNYAKIKKSARTDALGSMGVLAVALKDFEELCADIETKFRDNKKIPRSSTEHVKRMADAAEDLRAKVGLQSTTRYLESVDKGIMSWLEQVVLDGAYKSRKSCPPQIRKGLAEVKRAPTAGNLNEFSTGAVRTLNQPVGNLAKFCERGWGRPNPAFRQAFDALEPYAGGQLVGADADAAEVLAKVEEMRPHIEHALELLAKGKF